MTTNEWVGQKSGSDPTEVVTFITKMLASLDETDVKSRLLAQRMYARCSPEDLAALQDASSLPLYRRKELFQKLVTNMTVDPEFITPLVASSLENPLAAVKALSGVMSAKDDRPSDNVVEQDNFRNIILLAPHESAENWLKSARSAKDVAQVEPLSLSMEGFEKKVNHD